MDPTRRRGGAEDAGAATGGTSRSRDIQARLASSVWTDGGCRSWYLDPDGGTSVLWPGYTGRFRKALRRFDPADYQIIGAPERVPAGVAS